MNNMNWYNSLNMPLFNPPEWVFAPVWSILYLMIFASFFIFLKTKSFSKKTFAIIFFSMQLLLNFLWTTIFFTLKDIFGGLIIVCLMWIFILFTVIEFFKISKLSAYLLLPYFLWTTFAVYLNASFYFLNK